MNFIHILLFLFNRHRDGWALGATMGIIFLGIGVWYFLFPDKKEKEQSLKENLRERFGSLLFGIISFIVFGLLALLLKNWHY